MLVTSRFGSCASKKTNDMKGFFENIKHGVFAGFASLSGVGGKDVAPFLTAAFNSGDMAQLVNAAFKAAIAVGAILAVLQLAYAGFLYMGGDSWGTKENAKQRMRNAVTGLFLLLAIWLILEQINPQILNLNVLPDPSAGFDG